MVGSTSGFVWGTDDYTTDSQLAVAAVHAGVLKPGERGRVRVRVVDGLVTYEGTTRNGVTSRSWGSYASSFRVERAENVPAPIRLTGYEDRIGQTFVFDLVGSNLGSVYGTDVYTSDSYLGAAAVHAGVLAVGERGSVKVTMLPGQQSYMGSSRNGINSTNWSSGWPASYRVERAE